MQVKRLTDGFAAQATRRDAVQALFWEEKTAGFGLRVGAKKKTWIAQHDIGGKCQQVSLGHFPDMKVEEARRDAKKQLALMEGGKKPKHKAGGLTLREALELYASDADRDPRTVQDATYNLEKYLHPWLDRPLQELGTDEGRAQVNAMHKRIIRDIAAGKYALMNGNKPRPHKARTGHVTADGVMRHFRMIWNRAAKMSAALPVCPTIAIVFAKYEPKRNPIPYEQLPIWWAAINASPNEIRRDFLRVALLTGLRSNDLKTLKWEHVDFKNAVMHIVAPKGGKAFDLPVSKRLLVLLRERHKAHEEALRKKLLPDRAEMRGTRKVGSAVPWVFGAESESGHIVTVDEPVAGVPYSTHSLRHTFRQVGEFKAGLPEVRISTLMNHAQPRGTITQIYGRITVDDLRAPAQKIENEFYALFEPTTAKVVPLRKRKA